MVVHADRFVEAVERAIVDDDVRRLPRRAGSVNQRSDATDILERPHLLQHLGKQNVIAGVDCRTEMMTVLAQPSNNTL
jgi:hypothetical protein